MTRQIVDRPNGQTDNDQTDNDQTQNHHLVQFAKIEHSAQISPVWDGLRRSARTHTDASRVVQFLRVARGKTA